MRMRLADSACGHCDKGYAMVRTVGFREATEPCALCNSMEGMAIYWRGHPLEPEINIRAELLDNRVLSVMRLHSGQDMRAHRVESLLRSIWPASERFSAGEVLESLGRLIREVPRGGSSRARPYLPLPGAPVSRGPEKIADRELVVQHTLVGHGVHQFTCWWTESTRGRSGSPGATCGAQGRHHRPGPAVARPGLAAPAGDQEPHQPGDPETGRQDRHVRLVVRGRPPVHGRHGLLPGQGVRPDGASPRAQAATMTWG